MKTTIIGGGIIGLCSAYYLQKGGHAVEVLERGDFSDGCSHGNVGLLVPSHFIPLAAPGVISKGLKWMFDSSSPFYIQPRLDLDLMGWLWQFYRSSNKRHVKRSVPLLLDFHKQSKALYRELAKELDFSYEEKGMLSVCNSEAALREEIHVAKQAEQLGMQVRVLDDKGIQEFDTGTELRARGGVWFGDDAHLHPGQLIQALKKNLSLKGVSFHSNTEVSGFVKEGKSIKALITGNGVQHPVEQVILAGGAWSAGLARKLGLYMPIQPAKGYSITMSKPDDSPRLPVILSEAKVVLTPMGKELRIGGTLEMSHFNEQIKRNRVQAIVDAVPAYFPKLQPKVPVKDSEIWYGYRPCSPDGLPYIGRPKSLSNILMASGHAMLGISLGPATGRLVSEVISGNTPSLEMGMFAVERF